MTTPVIIDVIMAVVLIAAVIYGAHRGLFRALAGLAVVIVALVGAAIIANTLAAPAARLVTPLIREQIETKVDEAMARAVPGGPDAGGGRGRGLRHRGPAGPDGTGRGRAELPGQPIAGEDPGHRRLLGHGRGGEFGQSILYAALFLVSFVGLTILLKLLIRAMDLVLQLPGLHLVNSLGGAVIGLIEGPWCCF